MSVNGWEKIVGRISALPQVKFWPLHAMYYRTNLVCGPTLCSLMLSCPRVIICLCAEQLKLPDQIMLAKLKQFDYWNKLLPVASFCVSGYLGWQANYIAETFRLEVEADTIAEFLRIDLDLNIGNPSRDEQLVIWDTAKWLLYKKLLEKRSFLDRFMDCIIDSKIDVPALFEELKKSSRDGDSDFAKQFRITGELDRQAKRKLDDKAKRELDEKAKRGWMWWWGF